MTRAFCESSGVPSKCCEPSKLECRELGLQLGLELGCVLGGEFGKCPGDGGGW